MRSSLKLIAAFGIAWFVADWAQYAVHIEHDWGYLLVKELIGQADEGSAIVPLVAGQGIHSAFMQAFEIPLIAAGLAFGFLKQYWSGPRWWRYAAILFPLIPVSMVFLNFPMFSSELPSFEHMSEALLSGHVLEWWWLPLTSLGLMFGSMHFAEWLFTRLTSITNPWRIILPGLLAFVPGLVDHFSLVSLNSWWSELIADGLGLYAATSSAAFLCRNRTGAMVAGFLAVLPFLLFNLYNVGSNIVNFRFLDFDGFRATLSSILIFCWATVMIIAGSVCGSQLRRANLGHVMDTESL